MVSFSLTAVNIGTHALGESDRIVVLFSRERGIHRAVAKGARKPGTKMGGKSEPLNINRLLLSKGKSLDIITQCESIESFGALRKDFARLSYALYFAELCQVFGQELSQECERFFDRLSLSIGLMAESQKDPAVQCLEFEMAVLETVGLSPELTYCVGCRHPATEQTISAFNYELGGLVCQSCFHKMRQDAYGHTASAISQEDRAMVRENAMEGQKASIYVTPLVWKRLVIARSESEKFPNMDELDGDNRFTREDAGSRKSLTAARRLMQGYIEYKSGRRLKSLSVLESLPENQF